MIWKKLILGILIFSISIWQIFAFTTDEHLTIYYQGTADFVDVYSVPTGYDFIIDFIYTDDLTNSELYIQDNGSFVAGWQFTDYKNDTFFVIKDLLQIKNTNSTHDYILNWILVKEGENIKAIHDKNEYWVNKPVFDEETIQEIYLYEGIVMLFIVMFTFFARLFGFKGKKRNKYF